MCVCVRVCRWVYCNWPLETECSEVVFFACNTNNSRAINNHNSNSKRTGNIIHAKNKFESDDNNNNNIGHRSIALIT